MSQRTPRGLIAYSAALVAVAVVLLWRADLGDVNGHRAFWNALGALIGLGLLAEAAALNERVGTVTTAVSFVPYLACILLLGPGWAMVVAGCTELFAETVIRQKPLLKIGINTGKEVIAVGVAGSLYVVGRGVPNLTEFQIAIPAFLGATVTYFIISNGSTAIAVALSGQNDLVESWNRIVNKGLVENVLSSSISILLAFLYIQLQLWGLLIVVLPLFFVRHLHRVNLHLEQTNRELLEVMVKSIEARDPYTSGHSLRVSTYARALARALGLSTKDIEYIETAALLHDVGKIYEEFAPILRKEGKMNGEERLLMETHPIRSADLIGTVSTLRGTVQAYVRSHHENFDGSGYPDGLAGDEIPVGARIIMVADTADAMMTDRPYRKALSYEMVVDEFDKLKGVQFDPSVVEAFRKNTAIRRLVEERGPKGRIHDRAGIRVLAH